MLLPDLYSSDVCDSWLPRGGVSLTDIYSGSRASDPTPPQGNLLTMTHNYEKIEIHIDKQKIPLYTYSNL